METNNDPVVKTFLNKLKVEFSNYDEFIEHFNVKFEDCLPTLKTILCEDHTIIEGGTGYGFTCDIYYLMEYKQYFIIFMHECETSVVEDVHLLKSSDILWYTKVYTRDELISSKFLYELRDIRNIRKYFNAVFPKKEEGCKEFIQYMTDVFDKGTYRSTFTW